MKKQYRAIYYLQFDFGRAREKKVMAEHGDEARLLIIRSHIRRVTFIHVAETPAGREVPEAAALLEFARQIRRQWQTGTGIGVALKSTPEGVRADLRQLFLASDDYWLSRSIANLPEKTTFGA